MINIKKPLTGILATVATVGLAIVGYTYIPALLPDQTFGATTLLPYQGGTGISSSVVGDVGKCLKVSGASPFSYSFGACAAGGSGGNIEVGLTNGTLNSTSSIAFDGNHFASTYSSPLTVINFASNSLDFNQLKDILTLDANTSVVLNAKTLTLGGLVLNPGGASLSVPFESSKFVSSSAGFYGSLTGHASLDLALTGGTLTGTLFGTEASLSGTIETVGIKVGNGAVGTPALSFSGDPNTGVFLGGTDIVSLAAGGVGVSWSQNSFYPDTGAIRNLGIASTNTWLNYFGVNASLSNNLEVTGFASTSKQFGAGLSDCANATTSKLLYTAATGLFSCGVDQNTGGGDGTNSNIPFLTIGNTSSLSFERSLTAAAPLAFTDGGVNSTYNLGLTAGYSIGLTASQSAWEVLKDGGPYLTGNQTITLTGGVTGSGATSIATTIASESFWDLAYAYRNIGHLQLAGGTLTGTLFGTTASFTTNFEVRGFASASSITGSAFSAIPGAECSDAGDTLNWANGAFICGTDATGAGGSPGGSDTQIQFNNGGVFGGVASLTWSAYTLTVGKIGATSSIVGPDGVGADDAGGAIQILAGDSNGISAGANLTMGGGSANGSGQGGTFILAGGTSDAGDGGFIQLLPGNGGASAGKVYITDPVSNANSFIDTSTLTGDHTYTLPDASGTIALTSDIVGGGLQIPTVVVAPSGGDATTIQAGINLASSSYPNGARVFLASSSFTITQSIRIPSNIQVEGNAGGTLIKFNGSSVSPAIKGKTTSTDSIAVRHISLQNTSGGVAGTAIDGSNVGLSIYEDIKIIDASLSMNFSDTANYTFYNTVRNVSMFDGNGCISIKGSTPTNDNSFYDIRCVPAPGTGHFGVRITKGQSNIFYNLNVEPGTGTGVTGLLINPVADGDVIDTAFYGFYAEANAVNVNIGANAQRTTFSGGQECCALTTEITDNGQNTQWLNFDNNFVMKNQMNPFVGLDNTNAGQTFSFTNNTSFSHTGSSLMKLSFLNTSDSSRLLWLKDLGQTSTALSVSSGATTGTVASISAALLTTGTGLKIEVPNSGFTGKPLLITRLGGLMLASMSATGNFEIAGFASLSNLFTVPTDSALTQNGQIAVDNSGFGQFAYRASGSDHILTDEKTTTVSIGSTSFSGWASKSIGYQFRGGTIKRITCQTKSATSIVLRISRNGTTDMDSLTCAETRVYDDGTIANATFVKGDVLYLEKGAVSGEVDNVDLTFTYVPTRE